MMTDRAWSVAEAKARFSELVEKARTEGPQHVTRHGRDAVVVVSATDWENRTRPGPSLVEVLLDPSVRGVLEPGEEMVFERDRSDGTRSISF